MLGQNADELAAWVTAVSGWRTQANSVNISLDTVQLTLPEGYPEALGINDRLRPAVGRLPADPRNA